MCGKGPSPAGTYLQILKNYYSPDAVTRAESELFPRRIRTFPLLRKAALHTVLVFSKQMKRKLIKKMWYTIQLHSPLADPGKEPQIV